MSAGRWLMDHESAVEKLEGVSEIETSLRQDFLALFLVPFEFHDGDLSCVATVCNHICSHEASQRRVIALAHVTDLDLIDYH